MVSFLFFKYIKTKKIYWILTIITAFICIYFQTPFASAISKTFGNILVGISVMIMFIIFYLLLKEEKNKEK